MIRFRCSKCGKKLKAEEEIIGRKVRCSRCESVELVPPEDNLAKPFAKPAYETETSEGESTGDLSDSIGSQDENLQVVKPNRTNRKSFGAASDQPVPELFGHSAAKSDPAVSNIPKFNVVEKKKSRFDLGRWIVPAIMATVGLGLAALIAYFVVASRYAEPSYAAEFENLEEVKYYHRWHVELERSRTKMSIMSSAFQSANLKANSFSGKFDELDQSVDKYTNNSRAVMEEAATLFAKGRDLHAKSVLVTTAREMQALRDKIDREVAEFNEKIHQR